MLSGDTCSPCASIGPPQPTPTPDTPERSSASTSSISVPNNASASPSRGVGASTRAESVPLSCTKPAESLVPPTSTAMTSATGGEGSLRFVDFDSFSARARLPVGDRSYDVFRLDAVVDDPRQLPFSIRVLVENLLRREDGVGVTADDIGAIADRSRSAQEAGRREIQFMPARVLMQDLTGVPAIADLAALRDAV